MRNNFHYYMCSWLIFVILLNFFFFIVSAASTFMCFVIKVLFCKVFVLTSIIYV